MNLDSVFIVVRSILSNSPEAFVTNKSTSFAVNAVLRNLSSRDAAIDGRIQPS